MLLLRLFRAVGFDSRYVRALALEGDDRTRLVGPIAAQLPVGIDFAGRPFDEPLLIRIAAAYEAATKHRRAPPAFGPLKGEPGGPDEGDIALAMRERRRTVSWRTSSWRT